MLHCEQQILGILKKKGKVGSKDVSQSMEALEDTIRRDLRELAQEGLLQRVHGGGLPASPAMLTPETLVLASSEKLNPASPYEVVGLEDINGMIIGRNVEQDLVRPYAESGVTITRA